MEACSNNFSLFLNLIQVTIINLDFSIAQQVERQTVNLHVLGSIPSREAGRLI